VANGNSTTLTVTATGTPTLMYQWYDGDSGNTGSPVSGATSATFNTPAITTTKKYWVKVGNGCGTADSATIVLTPSACTKPAILSDPQSQTVLTGSSVTLTVGHNGTSPFTYQWYQGSTGNTQTPVGQNQQSFTTPVLTQTTSYWARVSNTCGSADSATATITVTSTCAPPQFTVQPLSFAVPAGTNTMLLAT